MSIPTNVVGQGMGHLVKLSGACFRQFGIFPRLFDLGLLSFSSRSCRPCRRGGLYGPCRDGGLYGACVSCYGGRSCGDGVSGGFLCALLSVLPVGGSKRD